jgi:hypothetical protein
MALVESGERRRNRRGRAPSWRVPLRALDARPADRD